MQVFRENDNVIVAEYSYDSWGNILSATGEKAEENPFRYRGYYYDGETGFYYLQSRYYDSMIRRFINVDGFISTGQGISGHNMFVYCGNNPVNYSDSTGMFFEKAGDFFEKAGDFFEEAGEALYSGAEKLVDSIAGSFQIEIGFGYGLGGATKVGPFSVELSAYQDGFTIGYKNGDSYTATKGSAGLLVGLTEKMDLGVSTEYEHRFETNSISEWNGHITSSAPWEIYNCPQTLIDPWQVSIPFIDPVRENISSEGFFLGVGVDAHLGIGGHFTIGWDVEKFWELLTE